ncbi:hypothetical protein bcere0009_4600 [Bacillus cereus R309803]|nr:hypothetical protein bcere0009_4600 [Bacillus cereus R309803]
MVAITKRIVGDTNEVTNTIDEIVAVAKELQEMIGKFKV